MHDVRLWPVGERVALADRLVDAAQVDLLRGDPHGALRQLRLVQDLGLDPDQVVLEEARELLALVGR